MAALQSAPNWSGAARALISGCLDLPGEDDAVALMETVCRGLGDELYPAFLRVLCEVGRHGEHDARAAVARALVQALRSGRLPSGRRAAWGAAGGSASRSLGPLEYLCAWAGQADPAQAMPAREFEAAARPVMALVAASDEARHLYCEKLLADAAEPLEGALTRGTRQAMRALAQAWAGGAPAAEASAAFLSALPSEGGGTLVRLRLGPPPVVPGSVVGRVGFEPTTKGL